MRYRFHIARIGLDLNKIVSPHRFFLGAFDCLRQLDKKSFLHSSSTSIRTLRESLRYSKALFPTTSSRLNRFQNNHLQYVEITSDRSSISQTPLLQSRNLTTRRTRLSPTMPNYIGSIDQGTSSSRFIVFDESGSIVAMYQTEFEQIYPQAGWAEHDPEVIYQSVVTCIEETLKIMQQKGLEPKAIKAVGITNQRETTVVWDSQTGKPLHNAIVWLDTRTAPTVTALTERTPTKSRNHFQDICGLPLSTYFSGVKLKWLLDNVKCVSQARDEGRLCFGTIDSWLIYKLTGGANGGVHVTDVTNASRTMLLNLKTLEWDPQMMEFFGVNTDILPQVKSSSEVYGHVAEGPLQNVPIAGNLGDQQASLVGHLCFEPGMIKNTYGTGCFMLCNIGSSPITSKHGLLTTVGYKLGPDAPTMYAFEGSIAIAGAAVRWLRDNMGIINDVSEINDLAGSVSDSAGVYFVPAFSGLFAPYWREDARGCIVGLTQYTTKHHICRATLEAVSFQTKDIMDAMEQDSGYKIEVLRVDGGLTNSDLAIQLQSDISGVEVDRPDMREITALGAALAAGLAVKVWKSPDALASNHAFHRFNPKTSSSEREQRLAEWHKAIDKSLGWVEHK